MEDHSRTEEGEGDGEVAGKSRYRYIPAVVSRFALAKGITHEEARVELRKEIIDYFLLARRDTIYEWIAGYLKGTVQDGVAAVRWAARGN